MSHILQLEKMDTAEKLKLMEALWADLSKDPADVPIPDWHVSTLSEREQQVKNGQAKFSEWGEVKERLREETR
ncbi:MAG: addiction module protein [Gammaproteobacteria bacterium]|nr:addiction module protein [Gammaproteobacteria bacterium]MCW8958124.1 addiction module protein [Gammaproteobacteria bacterium]MCW8973695.1 addiction module protein [Gammaproteobacteria bacterium]MCW8993559.1 addiction module protein [Gammaproteobacteria bacterium]